MTNVKLVEKYANGDVYRKFDAKIIRFADNETAKIEVDGDKVWVPTDDLEHTDGSKVEVK